MTRSEGDPMTKRSNLALVETGASFNPNRPCKPASIEQALELRVGAGRQEAIGRAMVADGDYPNGHFALAQASTMAKQAAEYLDIGTHVTGPQEIGNGGELVVATREALDEVPGIIDTLRESPDMVHTAASRQRLDLAGDVGALTMAVDMADSIQARNSVERALAHELAGAHSLAMKFGARASDLLQRSEFNPTNQALSIEASRNAATAARLMTAFQDGFLALDRIRRGGKQTVKVVHIQQVAVNSGGQAVVTGNMKAGGHKTRGRSRK